MLGTEGRPGRTRRARWRWGKVGALLALLGVSLGGPSATHGGLTMGGAGGNANSRGPSLSASGRYVVFWSVAQNLSPLTRKASRSVFVRDLQTNRTLLASRQSAKDGGAGAGRASDDPALSADGRFVVFRSRARNLSRVRYEPRPGDSLVYDVYLRDLKTKRTLLVSRQSAAKGGARANGDSDDPAVSAHGRYVAFESYARNLSDAARSGRGDVFVRDLKTKRTILVSRQSTADGGAGADQASYDLALSADGRYVAFASYADNLSTRDHDAFGDVFVRDLKTKRTILVSRQSTADGGAGGDNDSYGPVLSADGRYVAFTSAAFNLSDADIDFTDDEYAAPDVFVRDMKTDTTVLASRRSAAEGDTGANGESYYPALSGDGRYVAFESDADNLSESDDNRFANVFLRDLSTGSTVLVSRQSTADGGAAGDRDAEAPSVSRDGRRVAFWSFANNLSDADQDTTDFSGPLGADVFVRDLQLEQTTLASRQSDRRRRGAAWLSLSRPVSALVPRPAPSRPPRRIRRR